MNFRALLFWGVVVGVPVVGRADDAAVDAAALFKRSCAMCHGQDGRAATPAAKKLGVKDLTVSTLIDEQIRAVVLDGVKNAKGAMPAFRAKLTETELDAIVAHVRSLRTAENPAKP